MATPADVRALSKMTSAALVDATIARHALFKHASKVLSGRAPDDGKAAEAVVRAFEAGRAPAWLVAHLLGCLRVPATYHVVRGILIDAPGSLAESYAGPAMARIGGAEAREHLIGLMRGAPRRRGRDGAVYGLGVLGDASVVDAIVAAARDHAVSRGASASALVALRVSSAAVVSWLRAQDDELRALAVEVVWTVSTQPGGIRDAHLACETRDLVLKGGVKLSPRTRERLLAAIAGLLSGT
jgi:hypothetical protein